MEQGQYIWLKEGVNANDRLTTELDAHNFFSIRKLSSV